jgi:hypothetical protein
MIPISTELAPSDTTLFSEIQNENTAEILPQTDLPVANLKLAKGAVRSFIK